MSRSTYNLGQLGWHGFFEAHFGEYEKQGLVPARVAEEHRGRYLLYGDGFSCSGEVSGRFRHQSRSRGDFPAVGDWVAVEPRPESDLAIIHAVLGRRSSFSRKAVLSGGMPNSGGKADEQVLAANIDTVFLVTGLDDNYSLRRIERYVSITWDSGATPVIVLNKADVCEEVTARIDEVQAVAVGVPVHAVSAINGDGLEPLQAYLEPGRTVAFLGSSGVGKSTLINCLLGEERLATQSVREYDGKGRHTTTFRQLIPLPSGGIVIDTPGMREIQAWSDSEGLSRTFEDIEALAERCRFADCKHADEPGCAVREALEDGSLDEKRYRNYLQLLKENRHLELRKNEGERRRTEREWDKTVRNYFKSMKELRKKGLA